MMPEIEENTKTEMEKHDRFIRVYFEFFYFFMHYINRILLRLSNQDIMERYLKMGWLYCCAAVTSIIHEWPQDVKRNFSQQDRIDLTHNVVDKLDEADEKYSGNNNFIWNKDKALDEICGDSVLAKLTRNIISQCGYKMIDYQGVMVANNIWDNMMLQLIVNTLFINITENVNFESLIKTWLKNQAT